MSETATAIQPKAERVYSAMRRSIVGGDLKPGEPLPTQRELKEQFGVADHTVSVAMSRLVQEGLVVRWRGRGSFVNNRMSVRTKLIDYVRSRRQQGHLDDERTSHLALIERMSEAFSRRGWKLRWHHLSEQEAADVEALAERLGDAQAVIVEMELADDLLQSLHHRGIAAVALYTIPPTGTGSRGDGRGHITIDRRESARRATEHMVSLGYRRISYFGVPLTAHSDLRMKGFLEVMRQHNLPLSGQWLIEAHGNEEDGWGPAMRQVLRHPDRPEAICCFSGALAYHAELAALAEGLDVPRDLAIMACDSFDRDVQPPVPISEVSASLDDLCDQAVRLLESFQNGAGLKQPADLGPVLLPLHLTVRESCGARAKGRYPEAAESV